MQRRGSKTVNLKYTQLNMQDYLLLENMTKNEAIALFKFKTRMAPFAENFRAGKFNLSSPPLLVAPGLTGRELQLCGIEESTGYKGELFRHL